MSRYVDFKVIILGQEYCGKTSIVERFLHNNVVGENNKYQNTIGAAYGSKKMCVYGRKIIIGVWDTAGSERYEAISKLYYRNARAAILCYDPADAKSYDKLVFWIQELKKNQPDTLLYFCATKMDLIKKGETQRRIEPHKINELANNHQAKVYETSAKTGEMIKELFYNISKEYVCDPRTSLTIFRCRKDSSITLDDINSTTCCNLI